MPRFLIAESETPDERQARRGATGRSSGETYVEALKALAPDARCEIHRPQEAGRPPQALDDYDGVFLTGSPMHVYEDTPEVRRQLAFMRAVFASGTPSFGSCAGLQIAVAAAGGRVRRMPRHLEAGVARRIAATAEGRAHPLLAGRPPAWDAAATHTDEVETLPAGGTRLAGNAATTVQAAEIRHDRGVFWGTQYHPELALGEIAVALRRQAADLRQAGLADTELDVLGRADRLQALHREPDRLSLRWQLGVDDEFATEAGRRRELVNFLDALPNLDQRPR